MLERMKYSNVIDGARLLEISCIRIAEVLKYSIFRGKTPDLEKVTGKSSEKCSG